MTIEINNSQGFLCVDDQIVREFARCVLEGESVFDASISIAFVDNPTIHAVNRRHLDHDWPTDVITFRLSDDLDDGLEAELLISAEMAVTTASEANTDPQAELMLYLVHGLLHLCGYDDLTDEQALAMRAREDEVLRREGWVNTFSRVGSQQPLEEHTSWTD